jgi:DNA-binding transcriptional ArsR family regulator
MMGERMRAIFEAGLRGDMAALQEAAYRNEGPWSLACRALLQTGGVDEGPVVRAEPPEQACFDEDTVRGWATLACEGVKLAWLMADTSGAGHWLRMLGRTADRSADMEVHVRYALVEAFASFYGLSRTPEDMARIESEAHSLGLAEVVLEAAAVRAFVELDAGDIEAATRTSRRAARMARTEGLPQQEYFANHVLARVRRFAGTPHYAVHILAALARAVPPSWRPWNAWETILAGGATDGTLSVTGERPERSSFMAAAGQLEWVLAAADAGDRRELDLARGAGDSGPPRPSFLAHDLDALLGALDQGGDVSLPAELVRWRRGDGAAAPCGLLGCSVPADQPNTANLGHVACHPSQDARRVLGRATRLLAAEGFEPRRMSRPGRIEEALTRLAFAGRVGIGRYELFRQLYGFDYEPSLHEGSFNVLVHRMRELVDGVALVERDADRFRLIVSRPFTLVDPRCERPLDDRLLRLLAGRGGATAKDAAAELGVPLRTAQRVLKEMTSHGLCESRREGRSVEYVVEDTTFQPPTRNHPS